MLAAGLQPEIRAERLSIEDFSGLAAQVEDDTAQ